MKNNTGFRGVRVQSSKKEDQLRFVPLFTEILLANTSLYREIGTASRFFRAEHELWTDHLGQTPRA